MEIIKTDIQGVLIIVPRLFRDARGYFFESFSEREFEEKVTPVIMLYPKKRPIAAPTDRRSNLPERIKTKTISKTQHSITTKGLE